MRIRHLTFGYSRKNVIDDLNIDFERGKITTILGANGSGKSTLFKICSRNLRPDKGIIMLDDENIFHIKRKDFAKKVAIVHQHNRVYGTVTVKELVSYGRTPYLKLMQRPSSEDADAINWALDVTGLSDIKDEMVNNLSGGQKQRVFIAMALAQKSDMILLDEPTTYLDIRYQIEILNLIKNLNKEYKITIVMVLHDINQAIKYSDNIIGLKEGRILFNGSAKDNINKENISSLYGIELDVESINETPYVLI